MLYIKMFKVWFKFYKYGFCLFGFFGDDCNEMCFLNCFRCNRIIGDCEYCKKGYYGVIC